MTGKRIHPIPPKVELERWYNDENLSCQEIARIYNVSKTTARGWVHHHGIPMRTTWQKRKGLDWKPPGKELLYDLIWTQRLNYERAAAILGCHTSTITFWLRQYDISTPDRQWSRLDRNGFVFPDRDELEHLFLDKGLTVRELAIHYKCCRRFLSHYIQHLGLEIRPSGFQGRYYTCADGDIVRSSYERRVDNWLFEYEIPHQYEPFLPWGKRYRADFVALGYYIEVWGMPRNSDYQKRKEYKVAMYHKYGLSLIEIPRWRFRPQHDFTKPLRVLLEPNASYQLPLFIFI